MKYLTLIKPSLQQGHMLGCGQTNPHLFICLQTHSPALTVSLRACERLGTKETRCEGTEEKKKAIILRGAPYLGLEPRLWSK